MTPRVAEHSEDLGAAESADSAGLIGIGGGIVGDGESGCTDITDLHMSWRTSKIPIWQRWGMAQRGSRSGRRWWWQWRRRRSRRRRFPAPGAGVPPFQNPPGPPGGGGGFPAPGVGGFPPGPPGGGGNGGGYNNPDAYNLAPQMKNQIDVSLLPEWDGEERTALTYFAEVQEFANAGGTVPQTVGIYLWQHLTKGSSVLAWYVGLPPAWKAIMRGHYLNYLYVIKTYWLGDEWVNHLHDRYKDMRFRGRGREHKKPQDFIQAQLLLLRALLTVPPGSAEEVREVMRTAPITWKMLLNLNTIPDTPTLIRMIGDRQQELIVAAAQRTAGVYQGASKDYLEAAHRGSPLRWDRECRHHMTAMVSEKSGEDMYVNAYHAALEYTVSEYVETDKLKYAFISDTQHGEARFVDNEPHAKPAWDTIIEEDEPRFGPINVLEEDVNYVIEEIGVDYASLPNHHHSVLRGERSSAAVDSSIGQKPYRKDADHAADRAFVDKGKPYAWDDGASDHSGNKPFSTLHEPEREGIGVAEKEVFKPWTPPAPKNKTPIVLQRKRVTPDGLSAVGVSVLSIRGRLGSLDGPVIDMRVDSCADITLVSQTKWESMNPRPKLRQGLNMGLYQLTDKGAKISGYFQADIFVIAEDGTILSLTIEAYLSYELCTHRDVAAGTFIQFGTTPYEIRATPVGRSGDHEQVEANMAQMQAFVRRKEHRRRRAKHVRTRRRAVDDSRLVRAARDVKILPHHCASVEVDGQFFCQKEWLVEKTLLADKTDSTFVIPNTLISAHNPFVPVSNTSDHPRYIRKGDVIGQLRDPQEFFDTPYTEEDWQKMANHASMTRTIIEEMRELEEERSQGGDDKAEQSTAEVLHAQATVKVDEIASDPAAAAGASKDAKTSDAFEDDAVVDDGGGPKTSEVPDNTVYLSAMLREILDVGDLPEHLKERAWEMLERNQNAFGFDGRLGHLEAKAHVRTVDGQQPIAVPTHGASPAKRQVIEEQIAKWFEQDVIEDSISPWSAPVVIAYRNGKPRFCVDYRKLNAVTVPDEFPHLIIPYTRF
ncbi:hypothetical protein DFH06DRAFT_1400819 [Mycena polygramma]|nr:hypothetical protein DFH06DRAFT_1400819 [Mycena polygramma]